MSTVGQLPAGSRGVDCNRTLSTADAAAFQAKGVAFVVRYLRRAQSHTYDLTATEAAAIHAGGLAISAVQHVANPGWTPSSALGGIHGLVAAHETRAVGIPPGVTVWLDLEGVAPGTMHSAVIAYCKAWYRELLAAGYEPGLYVGYQCGLSPQELYYALPFTRYWRAYNLNTDQGPVIRGFCMAQHAAHPSDFIPGFDNQNMDVDEILMDAKGGLPTLWLP